MNSQTDVELLYEAYLNPLSADAIAFARDDATRAPIDSSTGLAKPGFFERVLEDAIGSARTGELFVLLAIKIDQFAELKRTIGEDDFEQPRRFVAYTLKRNIRGVELASEAPDGIFLVLLPETARAGAETVAQGLRRALSSKSLVMRPSGRSLGHISASVGIAAWRPEDDTESIIRRARRCMMAGHEDGGDRVVSEDDPQSPEATPRGPMSAAERMVDAELSESPFEIVFYVDPDTLLRTDPPPKGKAGWKP